jgi:molybdopterin synthase catalytic subunit
MINLKISDEVIDTSVCIAQSILPSSGGMNVFIGTVRSHTKGKRVILLEYECYERMALKEMQKIARKIEKEFKADTVLMFHRVGKLKVGEIVVLIVVACAHRDEAFKACRYAIDTLKETVPIWKKEVFKDGEVWVSATP